MMQSNDRQQQSLHSVGRDSRAMQRASTSQTQKTRSRQRADANASRALRLVFQILCARSVFFSIISESSTEVFRFIA
jgi:hypothetical protein